MTCSGPTPPPSASCSTWGGAWRGRASSSPAPIEPEEVALGRRCSQVRAGGATSAGEGAERIQAHLWRRLAGPGWTLRSRSSAISSMPSWRPNPTAWEKTFRRELAEHTGGHPLFTVELLRAMQARGDLVRDEAGCWTEGPVLDWETLPARVEGVIEERVGAAGAGAARDPVGGQRRGRGLYCAGGGPGAGDGGGPVAAPARAGPGEAAQVGDGTGGGADRPKTDLSQFKFGHALVQNYLYQQLSQGGAAAAARKSRGRLGELLRRTGGRVRGATGSSS